MKPRALLWPLLAVVLAALALAEVSGAFLLRTYVTRPDSINRVSAFVTHLKTIGSALEVMPAREEQEFLREVGTRNGIRLIPVHGDDGMRPAADAGPVVHLLRQAIQREFGRDTDVFVRDDEPEQLWVRLPMHGDADYWVGFPRRRVQQNLNLAFAVWSIGVVLLAFGTVWAIVRVVARASAEAERERSVFLAGISHDLRTPLGHLRVDLELARDALEPDMRRDMLADVDDMEAILGQFIDFAGSEANEPPSSVDLAELAAACAERVQRVQRDAGATGNAPRVRLELATVPRLMLRPVAMQRLVTNLINNAVRHGGGDVTVRCVADEREVRLSVLDRGPGIPAAALARVKEPFRRLDEGRGGAVGAGLGLAIAERIARLHGARLDLLAREGGGLEARVTVAVAAPAL